jgi:heptosyltransferase-2
MHLSVAVGTPVVAVFGATVPAFGFGPLGPQDVVVETQGLACRPCSIHGGETCPIKTFVCMNTISSSAVYEKVISIITGVRTYA